MISNQISCRCQAPAKHDNAQLFIISWFACFLDHRSLGSDVHSSSHLTNEKGELRCSGYCNRCSKWEVEVVEVDRNRINHYLILPRKSRYHPYHC